MVEYRYPIIARVGWPYILIVLAIGAVVLASSGVVFASPFAALAFLLLLLFRDPRRTVPSAPLAVVAPVDGRVIDITTQHDPFAGREAIRIRIRKGILSLYTVRSPMEGKVQKQWLGHAGTEQDGLTLGKGCFAQWVQSDEGDDKVTVVRPDYPITRLHCYVHSGERIGQGQRCGWLAGSATVEVFLPLNSRIEVKCGEHVLAGSGILATLIH